MKYIDKKVSEYLDSLGARSPVPGGGSAAALVGAMGAALSSMVAHFTQGKEGYEKVDKEIKKILLESYRIRERLSHLVDEDIKNYLEVSKAQRTAKLLSKKESKEKIVKGALRKALASSLNICKSSYRGLLISRRLAKIGNHYLKSDAHAASFFFLASFHAASLMSQANVTWLKDDRVTSRAEEVLRPLYRETEKIAKELLRKDETHSS